MCNSSFICVIHLLFVVIHLLFVVIHFLFVVIHFLFVAIHFLFVAIHFLFISQSCINIPSELWNKIKLATSKLMSSQLHNWKESWLLQDVESLKLIIIITLVVIIGLVSAETLKLRLRFAIILEDRSYINRRTVNSL